jgi:hypothetical protein
MNHRYRRVHLLTMKIVSVRNYTIFLVTTIIFSIHYMPICSLTLPVILADVHCQHHHRMWSCFSFFILVFTFLVICRTYESPQSWNGIRFANSDYEEDLSSLDYTIHDQSILRHVLISETNDYQPAIQTVYRTPAIERIHIEHSRQIGFEFLLPKQSILFGHSRITNALDLAINGLVYYGQSTDDKSTFSILNEQSISGQPFSLVNLCNAHRTILVKYRLITYFKYDHDYRTCSKLFCSNNPYKLGIRFFQVDWNYIDVIVIWFRVLG